MCHLNNAVFFPHLKNVQKCSYESVGTYLRFLCTVQNKITLEHNFKGLYSSVFKAIIWFNISLLYIGHEVSITSYMLLVFLFICITT